MNVNGKMSSNSRNTNIEIFRLLLMLGICFWHVLVHGFNVKMVGQEPLGVLPPPLIVVFLCAFLSPATYCFMFISGYYGMRVSKRKTMSFVYMAFFCFFVGSLTKYFIFGLVSWGGIARHIFPIATVQWWFLTGYMMVYLISPFINKGVEVMPKKDFDYILLLMTGLEVFSIIALKRGTGSDFYGLLYIYVLGRYMRKYDICLGRLTNILIYIGCLIILTCFLYVFWTFPMPYNRLFFFALGYNNPLIILMAVTMFFMVKNLRPIHIPSINMLLVPILYVYLLTEIIGMPLYQYEAEMLQHNLWGGIALVIVVVIVCLIVGKLGNMLLDCVLNMYNRNSCALSGQ